MKKCSRCNLDKDSSEFYRHNSNPDGLQRWCKSCEKQYLIENKRAHSQANQDYYKNLRTLFLDMYGNKCECCGETIPDFLTIDHVNGQIGKKVKERGRSAYKHAIEKYNPEEFRILCWNCNSAVRFGRICPHQLPPKH